MQYRENGKSIYRALPSKNTEISTNRNKKPGKSKNMVNTEAEQAVRPIP